jgi:predicted PurR-regulated permease PerM
MEGILALIVVSLLAAFCVRWTAARLRLTMPTRAAVMIVFVIVVLTLYGEHLRN